MAASEVELEFRLKNAGKQLSRTPDSVDELLPVLDKVEKLLLKVDQSPKKSMIEALKPSMNALIKDSLSKHSNIDVKVAVASCISEITRITAPDAPYTDDQMRDVFQLIVSSFEDFADQSSRSYNKRASILETVSKVRSCVIMLDLECDELIVTMFEHFLKSVRDFHLDSVFVSMENIMVLVIEESEEISVELLNTLLATVKKDREGVLPVAHKLAKGVLIKSADKLKPYVLPALKTLGESLDMYDKVVAAVCEGTTANIDNNKNDDNDSGLHLSNECKVEKGSVDDSQQADDSKLTTASSDHVEEAVKEDVDPTVENTSSKSVLSNGVNETVKEEASVDQESKKPDEEDKSQEPLKNEDTDADILEKQNSETEKTSEKSEKKADTDTIVNSAEPSDSHQAEDVKEIKKDNDANEPENETEKDNDVKESETEKDNDVKEPETEKDNDVKEPETEKDNGVKEPEIEKDKDDVQELLPNAIESTRAQEDETASPSKGGDETRVKVDLPENKDLTQEDSAEDQKQEEKESVSKEVKLSDTVNKSEDEKASSDSNAKPLKKSTESSQQKHADTVKMSEDDEAGSDSDAKPLKKSKSTKQSGKKSNSKKPKPSGKKAKVKGDESDSDSKPLKTSVKKGDKSKIAVENDSDDKPLKQSAKKSSLKKKDDGKKQGDGKNVAENDEDKSVSGDDEMNVSPKSATKSVKGEENSTETPATSVKRNRSAREDKDAIKYDESLIGTKVKVWWPEDKAFYEGVVTEYYPAKKKHKVSYVDGDEEKLNLKTQKWKILQEFSEKDNEEQNTESQDEEASPAIHKKKSKTDTGSSQEKIKDSAKRAGGVSSSSKSKGSTPKDNKSTKSKEDEETPKTSSKSKTVNKSKGKMTPSVSKSNTKSNTKEPEDVKSTESTKGGSKSGNKRKKRV